MMIKPVFMRAAVVMMVASVAPAFAQYVPPNADTSGTARYTTSVKTPNNSGGGGGTSPMPTPMPASLVDQALDQAAPLSPAEIRDFRQKLNERLDAVQENVTGRPPAKPVTSVEQLDLSPGAVPPMVRVAIGQGAVLSFQDAAGRPWPIVDNLNFNKKAFETKLIAEHLFSVALLRNGPANLTVVLKGLARPIVITALPATAEADYLKEYTVPKFLDGSPPADVVASATDGAITLNSTELISFLYRTPPATASELVVHGLPGVMAWQSNENTVVVRTDGLVVLPAWVRRHVAADGMGVYEMPISPVISISKNGGLHQIELSGYTIPSTATPSAK